jgi:Domain of unknown function (DUF4786)
LHAISASLAQQTSTSLLEVNEQQRYKKAINVSQSPITYVQRHEPDATEAKIVRPKRTKSKKIDSNPKKSVLTNHELLNSLGLAKLPAPSNHHRKRLATESRHAGRPDDSKIFVIKLPPKPYYYTDPFGKVDTANGLNGLEEKSHRVNGNMFNSLQSFYFYYCLKNRRFRYQSDLNRTERLEQSIIGIYH